MGLLHWEKRYSVGVEAVDHEHRELVDLINRLYEEARSKGTRTITNACSTRSATSWKITR